MINLQEKINLLKEQTLDQLRLNYVKKLKVAITESLKEMYQEGDLTKEELIKCIQSSILINEQGGATQAQAEAKVAEYRRALIARLKSLVKLAPKDKIPDINVLLKDFDKAAPKTVKWLMKHGIPK